jgi:hypothetical protein
MQAGMGGLCYLADVFQHARTSRSPERIEEDSIFVEL